MLINSLTIYSFVYQVIMIIFFNLFLIFGLKILLNIPSLLSADLWTHCRYVSADECGMQQKEGHKKWVLEKWYEM